MKPIGNESVRLNHFGIKEFSRNGVDWFRYMDPRLLVMLDTWRFYTDTPIYVSGSPQAVGRNLGEDSPSQHNVDYHGIVRAVDVLPEGTENNEQVINLLSAAKQLGFTGIGFYPQWSPRPGFHVDTRVTDHPSDPATWGYVDGEYISLERALEFFQKQ